MEGAVHLQRVDGFIGQMHPAFLVVWFHSKLPETKT